MGHESGVEVPSVDPGKFLCNLNTRSSCTMLSNQTPEIYAFLVERVCAFVMENTAITNSGIRGSSRDLISSEILEVT